MVSGRYIILHGELAKDMKHAADRQAETQHKARYLGRLICGVFLAGTSALGVRAGDTEARMLRISSVPVLERMSPPAAPPKYQYMRYIELTDPLAVQELKGMSLEQRAEIYRDLVTEKAHKYHLDPALFMAQIEAESAFLPHVHSPAGAVGLGQLMPDTAEELEVLNSLDPIENLEGSARYLRQQLDRFGQDPALALAAYNAGLGNVRHYGGVPPFKETQDYITKIFTRTIAYSGARCDQKCL
jgi:soluble lytic murein transglycosylase-like protein